MFKNIMLFILVVVIAAGGFLFYKGIEERESKEVEITQLKMEINNLNVELNRGANTEEVYTVSSTLKAGHKLVAEDLIKMVVPIVVGQDNSVLIRNLDDVVGKYLKVECTKDVPLTTSLLMNSEEPLKYEKVLNLEYAPYNVTAEDYVDVRLQLTKGSDFMVFPSIRIKEVRQNNIVVDLSEEQLLLYYSALKDVALTSNSGVHLYAVKINEPGITEKAQKFYYVRDDMYVAVGLNPNVKDSGMLINLEEREIFNGLLADFTLDEGTLISGQVSEEGNKVETTEISRVEEERIEESLDGFYITEETVDIATPPTMPEVNANDASDAIKDALEQLSDESVEEGE